MRFHLDGLEVFFPYDYIYQEQYQYMLELKRALDAKGDGLLEMPTGTGKTVSLLSLITSYQRANAGSGKLIYCTRTVPEMNKTMHELKRVLSYRAAALKKDQAVEGEVASAEGDILAVCLSSRRNMCIHPDVEDESDKTTVDIACRSMTASWVRAQAQKHPGSVKTCSFYEVYDKEGSDADLRGIYTLDDIRALGKQRGWCPYYMVRHLLSYANIIVFNYQYMLDPRIAALVSRELDSNSVVVFDEAHNIDSVCMEALSVTLDKDILRKANNNLATLEREVQRLKEVNAEKLTQEYNRLLTGLSSNLGVPTSRLDSSSSTTAESATHAATTGSGDSEATRGGETYLGPPLLPSDLIEDSMPGTIRNADLFIKFMRMLTRWLMEKASVAHLVTETPTAFFSSMSTDLNIDSRPLRFAYSRLNSLLRTLEITDIDRYHALQLVTDFLTLVSTHATGFLVITEPYNTATPHIPDPLLQLVCLDASLALRHVLEKFSSVILTSGTLSPLSMYAKIMNITPVVSTSLPMSISRPCIHPIIVAKGNDQQVLTTQFNSREDPSVIRNYGHLITSLVTTVPDGIVAFFPSYSYMELIITAWTALGYMKTISQHKLVFLETKDIVETSLAVQNYREACERGRGAILFSISRGKVAEGIDFDRHYGRCVVVFGIPYQYTLSIPLRARLAYLRDTVGVPESAYLTFDALRQTGQCIGRIIRSKKDYGAIILADKRYANADKRNKLPKWVLQFLHESNTNLSVDAAVSSVRQFLKEYVQTEEHVTWKKLVADENGNRNAFVEKAVKKLPEGLLSLERVQELEKLRVQVQGSDTFDKYGPQRSAIQDNVKLQPKGTGNILADVSNSDSIQVGVKQPNKSGYMETESPDFKRIRE